MRRNDPPLNGTKYCASTTSGQVHDLDNEKILCYVDDILRQENAVAFETLEEAHQAGYTDCEYCIGP